MVGLIVALVILGILLVIAIALWIVSIITKEWLDFNICKHLDNYTWCYGKICNIRNKQYST